MEALSTEIIVALVSILGLGNSAIHFIAFSRNKRQKIYLKKKK